MGCGCHARICSIYRNGGGLKSVLSIMYPNYWFVLPYLAVFMLSPWINLVLQQASDKTLKYYLSIMIAIEMLLP